MSNETIDIKRKRTTSQGTREPLPKIAKVRRETDAFRELREAEEKVITWGNYYAGNRTQKSAKN